MANPTIIDWADLLWRHFIQQWEGARKAYLSVDRHLFSKLGQDLGIEAQAGFESFVYCAKSLYEVQAGGLRLKNHVFTKQENGYSLVICIASQQVLVAELMYEDDEYSQDAYFPRYRQLLDMGCQGNVHSLPIPYPQHRMVWSTLREEMLSAKCINEGMITFREGRSRRDLNRNFPISQALFSIRDLNILHDAYRSRGIIQSTDKILERLFYGQSHRLTGRGQGLIRNDMVRTILYEQFRSFIDSPVISDTSQKKATNKLSDDAPLGRFELRFLQQGFDEKYLLYFWIDIKRQVYGEELAALLTAGGSWIHIMKHTGTHFVEVTSPCLLEADSSYSFLVHSSNTQALQKLMTHILGSQWQEHVWEAPTDTPAAVTLICDSLPTSADGLIIDVGVIRNLPDQRDQLLQLSGGILIDARSHTFLSGYPPTALIWEDEPLASEIEIEVNAVRMSVSELLSSVAECFEFRAFHIVLQDQVLEFTITHFREKDAEFRPIGYPLKPDKIAQIREQRLETNQNAVVGLGTLFPVGIEEFPRAEALTEAEMVSIIEARKDTQCLLKQSEFIDINARIAATKIPNDLQELLYRKARLLCADP